MRIIDYKYITGTHLVPGIFTIPELDREAPSAPQFINLAGLNLEIKCPTALVYIESAAIHQSEGGLGLGNGKYRPAIKSLSTYMAHQWVSSFENNELIQSVEITNGTCASGVQAICRAQEALFNVLNPVQEVIIIGHERISPDTVRLFRELGIPVTCGDGFVYMRLTHGIEISKPEWHWAYNENPFVFSREDLDRLIPSYRIGYVKLHATGTPSNSDAEAGLAAAATPLAYKAVIGHTQGISALLETCLILDDPKIRGRILVTANGLGGYYGAFTLTKNHARNP